MKILKGTERYLIFIGNEIIFKGNDIIVFIKNNISLINIIFESKLWDTRYSNSSYISLRFQATRRAQNYSIDVIIYL